jgi:hypothetical protein
VLAFFLLRRHDGEPTIETQRASQSDPHCKGRETAKCGVSVKKIPMLHQQGRICDTNAGVVRSSTTHQPPQRHLFGLPRTAACRDVSRPTQPLQPQTPQILRKSYRK